MTWISVIFFRAFFQNTMGIHYDSITILQQFDMLFSTFLMIYTTAYCLYKLYIVKKLEEKSSSFLDFGEMTRNLTFVNFFSCCVMYFLCIYYISPYYVLIISYFLGLSCDIFVNTSGIILKLNPALKSVHGIFNNFNITNFKLKTPFFNLHEKRLSGYLNELVTERRPPVSLNKNISIINLKTRPLSNVASMLVDRGIFKDTILYVKPCFVFSAVSGKNIFSIRSNNGNTDYIHFVETRENKKSDLCDILKIYSKKKTFKVPLNNTYYYTVVKYRCIITNYDDMINAFHNKEILGVGKKIHNLNIMKKAIGAFYNNNLEYHPKLLEFSFKNSDNLPVYNELFSDIKPSNKGYSLDDLSVYNKSSSPFLNMLMGKTYDHDHMFGNEVNMNRFNNDIIVNMMHINTPDLQSSNIGGDLIRDVNWKAGLYFDKDNKLIYIVSKKTFNLLNSKHEVIDNLYYQTDPSLSNKKTLKSFLTYKPFTSETYTDEKIALYIRDGESYKKSPLYGSTFKLDECVKIELGNIWCFSNQK